MAKKKNNKSAIITDKDKEVARRNRAIYSATDPTTAYPSGIGLVSIPLRAGAALFNPDEMQYEVTDSVADAAWRKRLGLSYDNKFLIENEDGSYRLPKNVEMEIPTDTTFIKRRIAANEKLANQSNIMGEDWKLVDAMIDLDKKTLDALRKTYETGDPVVINEYSNNSRKLAKDGEIVEGAHDYKTPLNVLQNYTIQYDPVSNTMKYRDTYDFNGFEFAVPGEPFEIKGSVPLNKYGWGGDFIKGLGLNDLKDTFSGTNVGEALKEGLGAIGQIAGKGASSLISGGLQSGAGNAISGVTGTIGSAISKANPVLGGIVSIGGGIIGGVTNQLFGSKLNKEKIVGVESDINRAMNYTSNAGDYDALASNYMGLQGIQGFDKRAIGKDGLFSNKAKNKFNELREQADIAEQWQYNVLANNAQNIADTNLQLLEANYSAYGGPIDMKYTGVMSPFGNQFKDGGIFIKPSKRGTFTAAAKKRGMEVQEFASKVLANKEDYSSAMVKKANFARNASKWKHADGGNLFTNGVTTIGNGGTHEQNPYEGVQMGVDPQGIPNLVEEGEVIWNDYVFSNRLRVPKEVRQKYKLRGVTFADAAKQLQKESEERPNDSISKNGLNASMTMLQQEQEATRMKKESNKYAKGGKLGRIYDGTGGDPNWLYKPVTPGFVPSKDDVLATMESMFPSLTETLELTQKDREMLGKDLISYINREEKVKPIRTNWLRYSPIVGSGLAVLNDWFGGNEPDYTNANMFARAIEGTNRPIRARQIGNYLTYRPLDRDFYINKLNANTSASRRALANTSGGNRAAAMAGLLAADYNYGNQLGDLARKAVEYDLAQRQAVEEFNRGTSVSNAEMAMKADMANAEQDMQRARLYGSLAEYRDKILAANRAEKAANLTNFIQGLGDLGKELSDRDMVRWLYEKGVLKAANGGRINRKKRGGFTI
jgi:hypothetical protein